MRASEAPRIVEFDSVTSTQDVARLLMEPRPCPDLVIAKTQTAGRGRCGRIWCSPIGGMYATLIVPAVDVIAARAALAVAGVLQRSGVDVGIKWPNDLIVNGRKIAGLLIEVVGDQALVGVGINLDGSPISEATCVRELVDEVPPARTVAEQVWHAWPRAAAETILADYRRQCVTLGQQVRVACGGATGRVLCGVAVNVDETGALIVEQHEGDRSPVIVSCGDCIHLEPASGSSVASRDGSA